MACLDTITVQEFKDLFFRDFPYLPTWVVTATYNVGDEVYYAVNGLFYKCVNNGTIGGVPTDSNWEAYTDDKNDYIWDEDIEKAFKEAKLSFNTGLAYGDCDQVKHLFYYLTAHYLVQDISTSRDGLLSSGNNSIASKSAGNVSLSYAIPEMFLKSPIMNYYTKTGYGLKYLNLVYPYMIGNIGVVQGRTTP